MAYIPQPRWDKQYQPDTVEDMMSKFNSAFNSQTFTGSNYPPYNLIEDDEDNYRLTFAVPGLNPEEIEIAEQSNKTVVITAKKSSPNEADEELGPGSKYIYRGISEKHFRKEFTITDTFEIERASMANGMLTIFIRRIGQEDAEPKFIEINGNK